MPFAGFDDWDDCVQTMTEEEGHDEESAESICGALQAEEKAENGNADELWQALKDGAGLIADVGVDLVSGVDVPAIDSKWVAMKSESDDHTLQVNTPLLKADDTDQRISYAAAMIPREQDKEGDVAPTPTVEKAAHQFLKGDGGIDTDHSLIDGEGEPVESWVLKEERTFDLPNDGGEETYPRGTWMLGVEWGKEAWDRIQAGELTGLSIYGMAEHVPLEQAAKNCGECPDTGDTHKGDGEESDSMGSEETSTEADAESDDGDEGPTLGEVAASVESLTETVAELKDAVTDSAEGEEKQPGESLNDVIREFVDRLSDLDDVERSPDAIESELKDALRQEEDEDEMDDEDEEEMEESKAEEDENDTEPDDVEKRSDDAYLGKGSDARQTAAKGIEHDGNASGGLSYRALAEEAEE